MGGNYAIHQSCENGHLEVAKWLHASFKLTADDVKSDDFSAFVGSCSSGHLDAAMWVADTFAVTEGEARAHGSEALRNALYRSFDIILRFVYGLSYSYHMSGENLAKFLLRDA